VNTTDDRIPVTAAVLAGGRSLRMGVDKTMLTVDGESLLARVVEVVAGVCAHTMVVTNRPEAVEDAGLSAGVQIHVDEVAHQGPLGGLVTALANASDDWVLAVAADMPWLSAGVVRALWAARDGARIVVPVTEKGPEPLLALYHVECLEAAREALATGRRRLVTLFGSVPVVEVSVEDLRAVDPDLRSLVNVNTPEDLAEVRDGSAPLGPEAPVRLSVFETATRRPRGLPSERPVTIHLNDVEVATVQASPADLDELAVGFLVSEGLLADRAAFRSVEADTKRGMVWVSSSESVPDDLVHKTRYLTSGCGTGVTFSSVGHARDLEHVDGGGPVDADALYGLMRLMSREAAAYRDTGGMHACALARGDALVLLREDVGRHNALDKLFGRAWLDGLSTGDAVLLTTGRISYEMAVKAAKARVPIVVSRTAVTDLAAEISGELGITLVGYARGGKLVVYTHPERVRTTEGRP